MIRITHYFYLILLSTACSNAPKIPDKGEHVQTNPEDATSIQYNLILDGKNLGSGEATSEVIKAAERVAAESPGVGSPMALAGADQVSGAIETLPTKVKGACQFADTTGLQLPEGVYQLVFIADRGSFLLFSSPQSFVKWAQGNTATQISGMSELIIKKGHQTLVNSWAGKEISMLQWLQAQIIIEASCLSSPIDNSASDFSLANSRSQMTERAKHVADTAAFDSAVNRGDKSKLAKAAGRLAAHEVYDKAEKDFLSKNPGSTAAAQAHATKTKQSYYRGQTTRKVLAGILLGTVAAVVGGVAIAITAGAVIPFMLGAGVAIGVGVGVGVGSNGIQNALHNREISAHVAKLSTQGMSPDAIRAAAIAEILKKTVPS